MPGKKPRLSPASEKVDPYFRPLFDALYDMMSGDKLAALIEKAEIEIAPLAYMRGRTLNDSFIILDEAQNTTPEQIKMFLTRLGFGSRMVVTGDVTQVDLPRGRQSGLALVPEVLGEIPDISFVTFDHRDVVRHKLVQRIVAAYKDYGDRDQGEHGRGGGERNRGQRNSGERDGGQHGRDERARDEHGHGGDTPHDKRAGGEDASGGERS